MWTKRPFNSPKPNPFGRSADTAKETLSADSVKCPTCGSNIFFEPELNLMLCRNCGNVYSPDNLEPRGSLGISKEHDYMGDSDMSEDDKKRHELICNSCGAQLVTDEHSMSTMCPFCGSPALISRRMTREFKPDYIIPFKIDKDQAKQNMKDWIATRKLTSRGFKTKCRLTNMTALYVPFWLLDCVVHSDISGTGKIIKGDDIDIYEVNSNMSYYVKGVPFDASVKIANKLMEAIEPFDYSEMVKFDSKYLQGFYADKYEQLPTSMIDRIVRRMNKFSHDETDMIAQKYNEFEIRPGKSFTWLGDISMKYCLLPVWFMTIEFQGKQYQLAVNGQTGEASGLVPSTSVEERLESIVRHTRGKWLYIPAAVAVVDIVLLMEVVTKSASTNMMMLFYILFAIELITVIFLVGIGAAHFIAKFISGRMRPVTDANEFDEDPGLDSYFDSKRPSNLKVDEQHLRHIVTKKNGSVYGDNAVDL